MQEEADKLRRQLKKVAAAHTEQPRGKPKDLCAGQKCEGSEKVVLRETSFGTCIEVEQPADDAVAAEHYSVLKKAYSPDYKGGALRVFLKELEVDGTSLKLRGVPDGRFVPGSAEGTVPQAGRDATDTDATDTAVQKAVELPANWLCSEKCTALIIKEIESREEPGSEKQALEESDVEYGNAVLEASMATAGDLSMYSNLIPGINKGNPNSLGGLNWGQQLSADDRRKISKFNSNEPNADSSSDTEKTRLDAIKESYEYKNSQSQEDKDALIDKEKRPSETEAGQEAGRSGRAWRRSTLRASRR